MARLTNPVPAGQPTFANVARCDDLGALEAEIAIVGVPFGYPYDVYGAMQASGSAPRAIREQSTRYAPRAWQGHYDYDLGGDILAGRSHVRIVDCGDVAMQPGAYEANAAATTAAIRALLDRGAVPLVLGGDHAIPIPVFRAYERHGPITIVQLDAHIDWRAEVNGVTQGLSSPMRRASEMPWVTGMAQIGMRGFGSARRLEHDAAVAWGSVLVRAEELHEVGVAAVLERIPAAERNYITFDADGLDPSIAPGVLNPAFGGLTYFEATNLIKGIANKGKLVGLDFVEVVPAADVQQLTSLVAARLILTAIGAMCAAGQFDR
jgi:agmatinase